MSPFVTQMIQQLDVPRWNAHHVVLLNPRLAYATLLLQSLAVRGMVSSKTTRWLPSYVNGEDKILRQSLSILETLESMDAFPEEAALHLTAEQRRFVVLKLYDLMHLEGRPSQSQWAHFHHVRSVLAVDEVDVASGIATLDIKHQRTVLGEYDKRQLTGSLVSPHMTWACTMLFVMVADGAIEAGHLDYVQWSLSPFSELQATAVRRARAQSVGSFLSQCTESLSQEMRRFILLHAAQLMTLNSYIQTGKKRLFSQLLKAFRLEDESFQQHLSQLSFLAKPVFTTTASGMTSGQVDAKPTYQSHRDDKQYHQQSYRSGDQGEGVLGRRTLAENESIAVTASVLSQDNVQRVEQTSTELNRQALPKEISQDNVQQVPSTVVAANIQNIAQGSAATHRQPLPQQQTKANTQKLDRETGELHRERVSKEEMAEHREPVGGAISAAHCEQVEASVSSEHREQLSGVDSPQHREQVASSVTAAHLEQLPGSPEVTHREALETSIAGVNRQSVASEKIRDHRQRLSDDATDRSAPDLLDSQDPPPEESSRLDRWLHAWKKAISSESEVFQRKAGIRQQIPPIIHRKRIVDFSSLNIFIEYEHEKMTQEEASPLPEQKSYSYKLKTCIEVLNKHMDVVNQKLERVEAAKKRTAVS